MLIQKGGSRGDAEAKNMLANITFNVMIEALGGA